MNIVWILLLSLVVLAAIAFVASKLIHHSPEDSSSVTTDKESVDTNNPLCDSQCLDGSCSVECLLQQPTDKIVYFNDEELDEYKERASTDYQADEVEQFREVLYTMEEKEVPEWLSSLKLRKIELPDEMKDEVIIIIQELLKAEKKTK
jgi:hypothetical protein